MRKKISVLMIVVMTIVTLLPLGSAFAYTGGLLNGKSLNIGDNNNFKNNTNIGVTNSVTDNDELSKYVLGNAGTTNVMVYYEFPVAMDITAYQLKAESATNLYLKILYADGTIFEGTGLNNSSVRTNLSFSNVKKIGIWNVSGYTNSISEFDVFGSESIVTKSDVTNELVSNITDTTAVFTWTDPVETDFSSVYLIDSLGATQDIITKGVQSYTLTGLSPETNYTYIVKAKYSDGSLSNGKNVSFTTAPILIDKTSPGEITNVTTTTTTTGATFNWSNPADSDFSKVNIYQNGTLKGSSTNGTYTVSGLTQGTEYNYTFKTVDSTGNESEGITKTISTLPDRDGDGIPDSEDIYPDDPENIPKPAGEVQNLVIKPEYDKVTLSWMLPGTANFKNVTIYRDVISQKTGLLDNLLGTKVYAAALFETNGTSFTDLTVEPETEYKYTVTTTSLDGIESTGVTGITATPKKPLMADMSLPFSVKDLVEAGNGLLWIVGPFVLLGMSFLLFPKLRKLIVNSFRNNRKEVAKDTKDTSFRRFRTDEKEPKEKHEGKEHIEKVDKLQKERQEREKREREIKAAEPKIKEPRAPKESKRERRRAEKQMRIGRAARAPRAPRERTRAAREPRRKRGAS
ncbi:fibronectin type III domain-containing protein [Mesobacillus stamsii]|uniref:Chitodextrinase n=1 Tax=Mesobacillus stamsii TaxID=225347 RepID=A0ABU0FSJ1_9BACI|nr:fibronectin type III domain-containing protein [Mesobacillus stamsii]MDQ0412893.1 chitodextrinase [Mesobacillus stamsii]